MFLKVPERYCSFVSLVAVTGSGTLISGSFRSQQKLIKTLLCKNVKPFSQLSALLSRSTVETGYVVHWRVLYICFSAIHDMTIDTKHSFIRGASCHHAKRISCKISEIRKFQYVVSPPLENVCTPLYHMCIESTFRYLHKGIFDLAPDRPAPNPTRSLLTHSSAGSHIRSANVWTRPRNPPPVQPPRTDL